MDVSGELVSGGGDGEVQEGEGDVRNGPGEFESGVEGIGEADELLELTDAVINMAEEKPFVSKDIHPPFLKKGPDPKRQLSCSSDAAW
eukprot:g35532.t1